MKLQRIFAMTAVAAFALSTLTGCPWEQEGDAPSAPSSSSSRPSHDSGTDSGSDPDTPSSTPEDEEGIIEGEGFTFNQTTNTYTVENENGLQAWATAVKTNNASTNCTLEENITMSGNASLVGYDTPYTGTFDGNGKTISGLTQPLFDTIGSGGTVKNLTIDGEISGDGASGVASYNSGTIVNCTIKAAVNATRSSAGGIAGTNNGTITGCVVTGNVSGIYDAGGIAVNNQGTITGCMVTGNVSSSNYDAGGIVAYGTADTCYYSGTVTPGQYGSKKDVGMKVPDDATWEDAIEEINKHLTDCEYEFALDTSDGQPKPKLVKRNSAEQAVNRLLAQFWG